MAPVEGVHQHAAGEQARDLHVARPAGHAQCDQADAQQQLQPLAPQQRPQPAAHMLEALLAQQLPLQIVLAGQPPVERLPGLLEIVEFHGGVRRVVWGQGCPAEVPAQSRRRCLSRLMRVVTLLSPSPTISAISRVLRSSR